MEIQSDILVTEKTGDYDHYSNVYEEGVLKLDIEADENYLTNTASVVSELTANVFKGNFDLFDINLPAGMLSQYTRLEVIAFESPQLCRYLTVASKQADPLERMKYVVAGYVDSANHSACEPYATCTDPEVLSADSGSSW